MAVPTVAILTGGGGGEGGVAVPTVAFAINGGLSGAGRGAQ